MVKMRLGCIAGWLLAFTFVVVATAQQAANPALKAAPASGSLAERVTAILNDPLIERASFGISVTTLEGAPVYALNDGKLMIPASNTKLFTTAAASALLPVEKLRWTTRIVAGGPIDATGTMHGDLIVLGVGDPSISIRHYPYRSATEAAADPTPRPKPNEPLEKLANQIEAAGIKHIDGAIVGDDSFFVDEPYGNSWSWDDLMWDYGAPVSALSLNENVVELKVTPEDDDAGSLRMEWLPKADYYTVDGEFAKAAKGDKPLTGMDRRNGSRIVRVWGTIPETGYSTGLAVEEPAEFFAAALKESLAGRGITVQGGTGVRHYLNNNTNDFAKERSEGLKLFRSTALSVEAPTDGKKVVATHLSVPVAEDIKVINKVSQNLHAELLLRLLAKTEAKEASFAEGTRVVRQFAQDAGIKDEDFFFYDGSGLSLNDRATPRAFTRLLSFAAKQSWGTGWRESFPVAGVDGSLGGRFKDSPLRGKMQAKTGTHSEANALSGYLTTASGKELAFSILVNGHKPDEAFEIEAIDRICEAIAATN